MKTTGFKHCLSMFVKIALAMIAPWTSRKLWMVIIGLSVVISLFWTSVYYLYSFTDPAHITAFESMFQTTAWTVSAIILGYLGFQSVMDGFKRNVVSTGQQVVQSLFEKKEEKIEHVITVRTEGGAKAFDDKEDAIE